MAKSILQMGCLPMLQSLLWPWPSKANKVLATEGVPVSAEFVMANTDLLKEGGQPISAASVVFDLDGDLGRKELKQLSGKIYDLTEAENFPKPLSRIVQRLRNPITRVGVVEFSRIPRDFSGAENCYYTDLFISREHLPAPSLDLDWSLPCLVRLAKPSRIEHLPASWFLSGIEVNPYTREKIEA